MRMQALLESSRVASCIPIGTTSAKTKCVRSRNGRWHSKDNCAVTVCMQLLVYSPLRCVRTFRRCSCVFAVQIVANATAGMGHVCRPNFLYMSVI